MRTVFAIKSLGTPGGGAERVFVEIVNGLFERGHDIGVITFESASVKSFYDLDRRVTRLVHGQPSTVGGKLGQLGALPRIRRAIKSFAPDTVVAFMPSCYVPLGAALIGTGIPVIGSEHNVPRRYARQNLRWGMMLASSAVVAKFTAVNAQMRDAYPAIMRHKMAVVANPTLAAKARADARGLGGGGRILAVGRLHTQKDHLTLIRAFADVADEHRGWSLRILGDGDQRETLEREVEKHHLGRRIALPGTVRDISREYAAAQFYVIPSRFESQGLATVEALAHGLPAIGFADCPGTNQVIRNGVDGLLVDAGEHGRVAALAAAIRRLISDAALRQKMAENTAASNAGHALSEALDNWENLLKSVQLS